MTVAPLIVADTASLAMVLVWVPLTLAVTSTVTVQEALAASGAPLSCTVVPPTVAVTVPPHVVVADSGAATVTPTGRASVKPNPVALAAVGLWSTMRSCEVPPARMLAGVKDLTTPRLAATCGSSPKRLLMASTPASVMLLMTLGVTVLSVAVPPALPAVVMPFCVPAGWTGSVSV